MKKYNIDEIKKRLDNGDRLKDIANSLEISYQTLYYAITRLGIKIPKQTPEIEKIAIYSYKYGTKEAQKKFGVTPSYLSSIRYRLRRKHKFKLLDKELANL